MDNPIDTTTDKVEISNLETPYKDTVNKESVEDNFKKLMEERNKLLNPHPNISSNNEIEPVKEENNTIEYVPDNLIPNRRLPVGSRTLKPVNRSSCRLTR